MGNNKQNKNSKTMHMHSRMNRYISQLIRIKNKTKIENKINNNDYLTQSSEKIKMTLYRKNKTYLTMNYIMTR